MHTICTQIKRSANCLCLMMSIFQEVLNIHMAKIQLHSVYFSVQPVVAKAIAMYTEHCYAESWV